MQGPSYGHKESAQPFHGAARRVPYNISNKDLTY